MWGETAESMNEERLPAGVVVVIKAAKVSEYQGRSLNASFGSQILVNPDRPEARELLAWATQVNDSSAFKSRHPVPLSSSF